jgi:putative hemolysin
MEILVILVLIAINGLFSLAEMSLVSARKFKLENAIKKGSANARLALELSQNPTKLLSTVQIGITIIGILLGIYSGQSFTIDLENYFLNFEIIKPYAHSIAVTIVVFVITFVSILFGELLPKRIGLTNPESIAIAMSRPMKFIATFTAPFVWLLTKFNDILLKLLNIKSDMESKVTEEEIKSIIQESTEGGEIAEIEQDIVERVFEMGDRNVDSLMTHSSDITWLDISDDYNTIGKKIESEIHSAYPLCNSDINNVIGIVLLKDLYLNRNDKIPELEKLAKKPLFIAKNTSAYKVLEKFKKEKFHYGVVVDEYGSTIGFLTMDDLLDALLGDVTEDHHDDYRIEEKSENTWLIDGQFSFFEFLKYFHINEAEDDEFDFNTVAGIFLFKLNEVPGKGDKIEYLGYQLEVLEMDLNRIIKILCTKIK